MTNKNTNKNNIINYFLNCSSKKGRNNLYKNLIINSSTRISKHNYNFHFNNLFCSIILNLFMPFSGGKIKNKYKNFNITNFKSIFNVLNYITNKINNTKKKVSFDFYLKNEIYTLLNNSNNSYNLKLNSINLFNDINYNEPNIDINFDKSISLKDNINKKYITKINYIYSYNNFMYTVNKDYFKENKSKKKNKITIKLFKIIDNLKYIIKI